ncbi:MAG TPA: glycosyltransferase [Leadbetterella sp.]|nr:glycosyltransferase [Leadbetterella sp.]
MKLIYLTNSYPFDSALDWKTNELRVFKDYFDEILVVPFFAKQEKHLAELIDGISYAKPLLNKSPLDSSPFEKIGRILSSKFLLRFIVEGWSNKVFLSKSKLQYWVLESYIISKLASSNKLKEIESQYRNKPVIFYSYWGRGTILKLAFNTKRVGHKYVSRFHGYDLYSERQKSKYLPYQKVLIRNLDLLLPCSEDGKNYLRNRSRNMAKDIFTARLGTYSKGLTPKTKEPIFRIVSCSSIIPLKRVDIIAKSLVYADFPIEWVHIGDGSQFDELKEETEQLTEYNKYVKINLLGRKHPSEVIDVYLNNHFDLFLNMSEYEGVPVSIMEALSAGIPILAPKINGIPEIVDEKVGLLISPGEITPKKVWEFIKFYNELDEKVKMQMSIDAYQRYSERCNAKTNAEILVARLLGG